MYALQARTKQSGKPCEVNQGVFVQEAGGESDGQGAKVSADPSSKRKLS
jgi:hypothetical protein